MNESDFKVEFVIPEHLMGYLNDAAYNIAKLEMAHFVRFIRTDICPIMLLRR